VSSETGEEASADDALKGSNPSARNMFRGKSFPVDFTCRIRHLTRVHSSCCSAHIALHEVAMERLIEGLVEAADAGLRERLSEYMHTLAEAGLSADFLVQCANEFIKEQTNPDRRYSGC
jgi:hypothetical protein